MTEMETHIANAGSKLMYRYKNPRSSTLINSRQRWTLTSTSAALAAIFEAIARRAIKPRSHRTNWRHQGIHEDNTRYTFWLF